jgi:hypothetical protein
VPVEVERAWAGQLEQLGPREAQHVECLMQQQAKEIVDHSSVCRGRSWPLLVE